MTRCDIMTVFVKVKKEDLSKLKGFISEKPKTIYEESRLRKDDVSLIFYSSGKLLLQGKKDSVKVVADLLVKEGIGEKETSTQFRKEQGWFIGSDESLKGDTFGGIVVAAVKADENLRRELIELGVADSKMLADEEILFLAGKIKSITQCEVRSVLPEEYNLHVSHSIKENISREPRNTIDANAFNPNNNHNVTHLLNKLHKECAKYLAPGTHLVDKYPGCAVGDIREEKAESKYVEVAAASILARATALQQLDFLSAEAGFTIPKGSTHVLSALQELKRRNLKFHSFVKMHFWNVKEFLKEDNFN